MCELIRRDICYLQTFLPSYQVEVWSVLRSGRFFTDKKLPGIQSIRVARTLSERLSRDPSLVLAGNYEWIPPVSSP